MLSCTYMIVSCRAYLQDSKIAILYIQDSSIAILYVQGSRNTILYVQDSIWSSTETTLDQRLVFAGMADVVMSMFRIIHQS